MLDLTTQAQLRRSSGVAAAGGREGEGGVEMISLMQAAAMTLQRCQLQREVRRCGQRGKIFVFSHLYVLSSCRTEVQDRHELGLMPLSVRCDIESGYGSGSRKQPHTLGLFRLGE